MNEEKFTKLCKDKVRKYAIEMYGNEAGEPYVYVVWLSKTLQNSKALVSTDIPDGMYYELTYNGNKKELYFDAYKKVENKAIELD